MIKRADVIRLKLPFPNINSKLAAQSHMYICISRSGRKAEFVKCQTLKPYMLFSAPMKHYWDEKPDISRNPFQRNTRIDCDKEFLMGDVEFSDSLKTDGRPDVCEDVISHVESELVEDGYEVYRIDVCELLSLNPLVRETE